MASFQRLLHTGREKLTLGDYLGALAQADAALALEAGSFDALQLRGRALFLLGRDAEALQALRLARHARKHAVLPFELTREERVSTLSSSVPPAEASPVLPVTDALETLLALRERHTLEADLLMLLAELAEETERLELARDAYAELAHVAPDHTGVWEGWIHVLLREDLDAAAQVITWALARFPSHARFHADLGSVQFRRRRYAQAEAAFREALAYDQALPGAREACILCRLVLGDHALAIADTRALLARRPDDVDLHRFAIEVGLRGGDYALAMEHAHQLVRLQPTHAETYCLKAFVELVRQEPDAAWRTLYLGFHKAVDGPFALYMLVDLLIGNGEPDAAFRVVEMAETLAPDHPESHAARGKILRLTGHLPDALIAFRHAATLAPQDDTYQTWIGIVLENLGEYPLAMQHFNQVLSRHPLNAWTLGNRGVVHLALGHPELALADLTRALEIERDDAQLLFWRAGALAHLGNNDEAVRDLRRAIDMSDEVLAWLREEPAFAVLCTDPRVRELLARRNEAS